MLPWFSWVTPSAIVGISLLVGLWLRRFVVPRILHWTSHTRWEGDDVVIRAIRGPIVLWSMMTGIYLALKYSSLPGSAVELVGRVLNALGIFSVAWVSANALAQLITHYAAKWQVTLPMTSVTRNLAKIVMLGLGVLMILDSLGVKIGSLLAALGIGSLAIALGLQDTLTNLFAGVYVSLSKNIRVGDYIKLESGQEGYVTDIGSRVTKIHMLPDNLVIIPNAKLSQSIITNYSLPDRELAVLVDIGVEYASDLEKVERITCEVAREVMREVPGGVPTFEPSVRYHTVGECSVTFTTVLRAKEFVDQYLIKHEFIKRLLSRYTQEGITIPFPTRTIHLQSSG